MKSVLNQVFILIFLVLVAVSFSHAQQPAVDEKELQKLVNEKILMEIDRLSQDLSKKGVNEFSQELIKKAKDLDLREEKIKIKEEQLDLASKDLALKITGFREQQEKMIGCLDQNKKSENDRVDQLVKIITGMKPAKAAEIFTVQESSIAIKILSQLEADKASKIFNLMDKEISARLQKEYLNMQKSN
jgi:flagellar motility protein MotE (MotC chaperone)